MVKAERLRKIKINRNLGFMMVIAFMVLVFVVTYMILKASEEPEARVYDQTEAEEEIEVPEGWEVINKYQYGTLVKYPKGLLTAENVTVEEGSATEIIDCRKMSANLRESLTQNGENECYDITIYLGEENYIVVRTGDEAFKDELETKKTVNGISVYPQSNINLPQKRIEISNFLTNFIGSTVSYEGGESYIFYSGVVYKGADKYAITVRGDIDADVQKILEEMELE